MASNALGLEDLVAAMPHAAAVIDRDGVTVVSNTSWVAIAPDLAPLFSPTGPALVADLDGREVLELEPTISLIDPRPSPATSILAAIRGSAPDAVERLRIRPSAGRSPEARFVEVRVATIGDGSRFTLATCIEVASIDGGDAGWDPVDRHPLTGLPGRRLFLELLGQAMTMSDRHRYHPAALAVGISGLAEVEELHGVEARNELTVAVASRLKAGLRPGDVVAQTGDEQFVIMLPDVDGAYLAEAVAHRLGSEVGRPFRLGSARAAVELFIGVATAESSKSPATVLSAAEVALAEAWIDPGEEINATRRVVVSGGVGDVPGHDVSSAARRINVADLREEELVSYFQPIFDITDRRVVAGEALMRWRHPHYGVLSAGEFLGLAINSGLLATLTDQALVCSTETWADLRDRLGPRPPQLFVNLSPDQLLSRVAVDRLYHLLIATGLPPEDVVVEVTEEAMSTRFGEMLAVLTELRTHGLRVALDDFGSGYSSLGRLRHLPVDVIKVDQSMVRGLESDRRARQLLAAVATMATELDVECIVEGIETPGEAAIVGDLGFRYVQGFHFARPCPADDFVNLVAVPTDLGV